MKNHRHAKNGININGNDKFTGRPMATFSGPLLSGGGGGEGNFLLVHNMFN
jgi:hypothetical protein